MNRLVRSGRSSLAGATVSGVVGPRLSRGGVITPGGMNRRRSTWVALLGVALVGGGCASQAQFLDSRQAMAMQTAVSRGQFEMNCPSASGTILSREVIQPAIQAPALGGLQRAEFTIGVSGCGRRTTFVVVCPEEGDGCFAAGPGRFLRE
jgi:hypothetical protein